MNGPIRRSPITAAIPEIEQSVRTTYADYFACFQRRDAKATAAYFAAPVFRVAGGRATVLAGYNDVREMLDSLVHRLATCDYGSSRTLTTKVTVLDETVVLLRARGTRHDRAGVAFEQFDVLYTMVRPDRDSDWRIAALTSIDGA